MYAISSWILPYLVVVSTIIAFREPLELASIGWSATDDFSRIFSQGLFTGRRVDSLYEHLVDLEGWMLMIVALWSLCASAAALLLARLVRPRVIPALVAAVSCPVALCYWFINPWAIPLGAFAMVLLGHAMSRERRIHIPGLRKFGRESEDESTTRLWILGPISKRLVASRYRGGCFRRTVVRLGDLRFVLGVDSRLHSALGLV